MGFGVVFFWGGLGFCWIFLSFFFLEMDRANEPEQRWVTQGG